MVNSGSFDSDEQQRHGDRNAKPSFIQTNSASASSQSSSPVTASVVSLCKTDFSQTADSDLPSVAHAIEPTPTKTQFNSTMPVETSISIGGRSPERDVRLNVDDDPDGEDNSGTLEDDSGDDKDTEKASLCCSLPLDKVQGVLNSYYPALTNPEENEGEAKVKQASTRKLLCLYCDRTFVSANLRQKHVERCHSVKQKRRVSSRRQNSLTVTQCVYCDKLNTSEHTLQDLFQHLLKDHSNKYFACYSCEDRFLTSSLLADHNASLHPQVQIPPKQQTNDLPPPPPRIQAKPAELNSQEIEDIPIKITRSKVKSKLDVSWDTPIDTTEVSQNYHLKKSGVMSGGVHKKKDAVGANRKTSKIALKRSKRLQDKISESQKSKRSRKFDKKTTVSLKNPNELTNNSTKSTDKSKTNPASCVNPYPEFDSFYRVKKITDHSIDNLKISSLTFDDVFDKAFFNRIKCNIQENLQHHIDGKLFKNEESESRISNFEKISTVPQEIQNANNTENYGCDLSLNAVTPVASLSLTPQFGEDFEAQIEYGAKPSKKKPAPRQDEVHYKYFTRRKYQASILEHKENRDLSKLDMWTQLVIKTRQQKMLDDKKSPKEILEYTSCEEYKSKMQREELNRILDRRGPFEDLKEEASKKAALDKLNSSTENSVSEESFSEVREILNDILNKVLEISVMESSKLESFPDESGNLEVASYQNEFRQIPSYLNLRRSSSLPSDGEIDKSDKIALICSSQETENFELPTNTVRAKNEMVELTGEWARCRMYICGACGAKLSSMKWLLEHKSVYHPNVWVQHYEFVGNQSELYRHLSIPSLGKIGVVEETVQCKSWRRSEARVCTKCGKQCNSLGELHRHILECGGDWTWMLVRKKCKYKPYGAKSRRKRRGLFKRIHHTQKQDSGEKKTYKKAFDGPRTKPSDADTIQRMLANLPAKRSTRKLISMYDAGIYKSRKNKNQMSPTRNPTKMKCGKVMYRNKEKNNAHKNNKAANRRSLRGLNKVLSSRILDSNSALMVKRKIKNFAKRPTRQNSVILETHLEEPVAIEGPSVTTPKVTKTKLVVNDSDVRNEEKIKRTSPRLEKTNVENKVKNKMSMKKLLTGKINIKSSIKTFFPIKKKPGRQISANVQDETVIEPPIITRGKRRLQETVSEPLVVENQVVESNHVAQQEDESKNSKKDALSKLVRTFSIKKVNKKKSKVNTVEPKAMEEPEPTQSVEHPIPSEPLPQKRKLTRSFRKVINRMKKSKTETVVPVLDETPIQNGNQTNSEAFLEENVQEAPPQLQKIVTPSTLEKNENIVDISVPDPIVINDAKEDPPIPETIFNLQSNNELSLQAKGELDFDTNTSIICCNNGSKDFVYENATVLPENPQTEILPEVGFPEDKPEPLENALTVETCIKSQPLVPLLSPKSKGKLRKPTRGLNDCIAMLTNKLQQQLPFVDVPIVESLPQMEPPPKSEPISIPTIAKKECILRIPSFKQTVKEQPVVPEESALDLTKKTQVISDVQAFRPQLQYSIDRIIDAVVENRIADVVKDKTWSTLDESIQSVVSNSTTSLIYTLYPRGNIDDTIDFVANGGDLSHKVPFEMSMEAQIAEELAQGGKMNRKIGSIRKSKSRNSKISMGFDWMQPDGLNAAFLDVEQVKIGPVNKKIVGRKVGQRRRRTPNKTKNMQPQQEHLPEKLFLETNLDEIVDIQEVQQKIDNLETETCNNIVLVADEPHILENKTVVEEPKAILHDSDEDDVPLAALIQPDINPVELEQSVDLPKEISTADLVVERTKVIRKRGKRATVKVAEESDSVQELIESSDGPNVIQENTESLDDGEPTEIKKTVKRRSKPEKTEEAATKTRASKARTSTEVNTSINSLDDLPSNENGAFKTIVKRRSRAKLSLPAEEEIRPEEIKIPEEISNPTEPIPEIVQTEEQTTQNELPVHTEEPGVITENPNPAEPIVVEAVSKRGRRKSKTAKKHEDKCLTNDLFEDFSLVIKKGKGRRKSSVLIFENAKCTDEEGYEVSLSAMEDTIEPMDMELEDIPVSAKIIEREIEVSVPEIVPNLIEPEKFEVTVKPVNKRGRPPKDKTKVVRRKRKTKSQVQESIPVNNLSNVANDLNETVSENVVDDNVVPVTLNLELNRSATPGKDVVKDINVFDFNEETIDSVEAPTKLKRNKRKKNQIMSDDEIFETENRLNESLLSVKSIEEPQNNKRKYKRARKHPTPAIPEALISDETNVLSGEILNNVEPIQIQEEPLKISDIDLDANLEMDSESAAKATKSASVSKPKTKRKPRQPLHRSESEDLVQNMQTNGEIKENTLDLLESPNAKRKNIRCAKTKALENLLDDALLELTESERNRDVIVVSPETEKAVNDDDALNNSKENNIVDIPEVEVTQESVDDNTVPWTDPDKMQNNPDDQEEGLRRSRRSSRKITSYNENEIIDPILHALETGTRRRKKESKSLEKLPTTEGPDDDLKTKKKLNNDELFDLLKSGPDTTKPKNSFLVNLGESSGEFNDENFGNAFNNILEKSIAVFEGINNKDIDKIYEFTESSPENTKEDLSQALEKFPPRKISKRRKLNESVITDSSSDVTANFDNSNSVVTDFEVDSSKSMQKLENPNYCEICNRSFTRIENLIKHKRTLTHISKLSEIEAREAEEKAKLDQKEDSNKSDYITLKTDINISDLLQNSKPDQSESPVLHSTFTVSTNNHSLKLADIINDVLNKPVLEADNPEKHSSFSDIIMQNTSDVHPEFRRYKSLGERKSFDSENPRSPSSYYDQSISKTTLEKQISLLENIIEKQTGLNYSDDISMSSNQCVRRSPSEISINSLKQDDSSNLILNSPIEILKPVTTESFLKPPQQYEEISGDSVNLRSYDDQKLRKTLNRDEELFLECCSLLKSGSEVSNYSKKSSNKTNVINSMDLKQCDEPEWLERKSLIQKPTFDIVDDYSDNSRVLTPLGDSCADDASNSNTISSNWEMRGKTEGFDEIELNKTASKSFTFEEVLHGNDLEQKRSGKTWKKVGEMLMKPFTVLGKKFNDRNVPEDDDIFSLDVKKQEDLSDGSTSDSKKMLTKGAMKVFEGLKVSIPTEELNLENVLLNYSPKSKKVVLEKTENLAEELCSPSIKPPRTGRKSKPVKNKSHLGSKLLFKMNKKKIVPKSDRKRRGNQKSRDVYDFEETQDNSDVFAKPDYRSFRTKKTEEPHESPDNSEPVAPEVVSTSSVSSLSSNSAKKPKAEENLTKKKSMIMGRIFKNALKSKVDEEIRDIPAITNVELVENYVLNYPETSSKMSEVEMNMLFDKLLDEKPEEHQPDLDETKLSKNKILACNNGKKKLHQKPKKRARANSESTDDEFSIENKSSKKRAYRKNAKVEDNCINLEAEMKECIGVASRKSQRKCTSGKQNILVEYWSSDDSSFEALLESQILEPKSEEITTTTTLPKLICENNNGEIVKPTRESPVAKPKPKVTEKKAKKPSTSTERKPKPKSLETVTNRRKRAAANPLYHWSSSSEDETHDLIEVKPIRDEPDDEEDRPVQHGWIVGDSPKKLVTMLAQAKGKKIEVDCVKEQGKKRTSISSS